MTSILGNWHRLFSSNLKPRLLCVLQSSKATLIGTGFEFPIKNDLSHGSPSFTGVPASLHLVYTPPKIYAYGLGDLSGLGSSPSIPFSSPTHVFIETHNRERSCNINPTRGRSCVSYLPIFDPPAVHAQWPLWFSCPDCARRFGGFLLHFTRRCLLAVFGSEYASCVRLCGCDVISH